VFSKRCVRFAGSASAAAAALPPMAHAQAIIQKTSTARTLKPPLQNKEQNPKNY